MSDRSLRLAERSCDDQRLMSERMRADLCPGCGLPSTAWPGDPKWFTCLHGKTKGFVAAFSRGATGAIRLQWRPLRQFAAASRLRNPIQAVPSG